VGHVGLSPGVVDHQDEQPNGNESRDNTKFNGALLEERARLYSDSHDFLIQEKGGVFNSLAKKQ